ARVWNSRPGALPTAVPPLVMLTAPPAPPDPPGPPGPKFEPAVPVAPALPVLLTTIAGAAGSTLANDGLVAGTVVFTTMFTDESVVTVRAGAFRPLAPGSPAGKAVTLSWTPGVPVTGVTGVVRLRTSMVWTVTGSLGVIPADWLPVQV